MTESTPDTARLQAAADDEMVSKFRTPRGQKRIWAVHCVGVRIHNGNQPGMHLVESCGQPTSRSDCKLNDQDDTWTLIHLGTLPVKE
jgi:hypothetical protein